MAFIKKSKSGSLLWILPLLLLAAAGVLAAFVLYWPQDGSPGLTGSGLEIRFLDVGQGDAAVLLCDGKAMLIDGGPADASSVLYNTMKQLDIRELEAIVCTHPDQDHAGGLAGALNYARAKTAWCSTDQGDCSGFDSFLKYLDKQGTELTIASPGDSFPLGGAVCTIVGPVTADSKDNNRSLVVLVQYGSTAFLFAGDAEYEEEQSILDAMPGLRCDVLKVGHHGSLTSTSSRWLKVLDPDNAVISTGRNNSYGHPSEEVLMLLRENGTAIYRTDLQGTIICRSNGTDISFTTGRRYTEPKQPEPTAETGGATPGALLSDSSIAETRERTEDDPQSEIAYVINRRSRKFHLPECSGVDTMSDKNRMDANLPREELIQQGYLPCGTCKP